MESNSTNQVCKNCHSNLIGNYCHQCGQTASVGRITFKETFHQFLSSAFSIQGPFFSTIKLLALNPGKVFRDFIAGKRKSYYKPIPLFLLLTAIYLILRVLIDYDPLANQLGNNPPESLSDPQNKSREAARFMVNNINYIMFFLAFSIGLMLKIFFRRRYYLAEYTSIGFYITSMYVLIGIPLMLLNKYLSYQTHQFQLLLLILIISYCCYSLFNRMNFWLFIKYVLVSLLSLMLYIILGFGFSYLVVSAF